MITKLQILKFIKNYPQEFVSLEVIKQSLQSPLGILEELAINGYLERLHDSKNGFRYSITDKGEEYIREEQRKSLSFALSAATFAVALITLLVTLIK